MDILTTATQNYLHVFHGYQQQFLAWGQGLFFSLLTINLVWLCLWYAFDQHSFADSMPAFIKQFFTLTLFYTVMLHPAWCMALLKTMQGMGSTLTHAPLDPSALIAQGIALGNKMLLPLQKSSLLTAFLGVILLAVAYLVVVFVFISIALDLAVTLITVTALISVASFFLGFAALGATSSIARHTLDSILGHSVKLLGIYLVIAAGSQTISGLAAAIPTQFTTFDPYAWIVAAALLFWLLAKHLPSQLARLVTSAVHEARGTDAAALALSTLRVAAMASPALTTVAGSTAQMAKIAGSTVHNAGTHLHHAVTGIPSVPLALGTAAVGTLADLSHAVGGHLSDHFRHLGSKLAGGPGLQQAIPSVAERMYAATQDIAVTPSVDRKAGEAINKTVPNASFEAKQTTPQKSAS